MKKSTCCNAETYISGYTQSVLCKNCNKLANPACGRRFCKFQSATSKCVDCGELRGKSCTPSKAPESGQEEVLCIFNSCTDCQILAKRYRESNDHQIVLSSTVPKPQPSPPSACKNTTCIVCGDNHLPTTTHNYCQKHGWDEVVCDCKPSQPQAAGENWEEKFEKLFVTQEFIGTGMGNNGVPKGLKAPRQLHPYDHDKIKTFIKLELQQARDSERRRAAEIVENNFPDENCTQCVDEILDPPKYQ